MIRVDNQLTVDANAGRGATAKVVRTTKDAGEVVAHGAKVVGSKTADAASATTAAARPTTPGLRRKVSAKLGNEPFLKGSNVDIDTTNHVVTLKGTVPSMAGSARAEAVACGTEGVNRVVNHLVVSAAR